MTNSLPETLNPRRVRLRYKNLRGFSILLPSEVVRPVFGSRETWLVAEPTQDGLVLRKSLELKQ